MHPRYPNVFSPLRLGPVEVPNRFFFAPHGSSLSVGTRPSDDLVAYSSERVRDGGCGLVIVALAAHERARTRQPSPHPPENVGAFRALADAIHDAGGRIFGEPFYWWGGAGQWQPLSPPAPSFSPSVRQFGHRDRSMSTHAMDKAEIRAIQRVIRQTCGNLRAAGFDGVMLHASHAALIEQFVSPYFNERTDEYGGSFANRMRFAVEFLEAAREGAGPGMAVGMRMNCDELLAGGYDTDMARDIVGYLRDRDLLDFLDLDVGLEPQQLHLGMPTAFSPKQTYRPYVEKVRGAAGDLPVLSVLGRITTMAEAEAAIAANVCDMVGAARQLIAEPEFVRNARAGREEVSRTCIACNWCIGSSGDNAQGCTINPASYRERLWGVQTFAAADSVRKVVIAGGGPAGLEAARVAARRGHDVVLFEARESLGGGLSLWSAIPGREGVGAAVDWWRAELDRLGVDVRLGRRVDADTVLAEAPDAVIVATGSRYSPGGRSVTRDADIPGFDGPHVFRPEDILLHGARPAGKVLLVDGEGHHASCGVAEILALGGAEVTYVTAGFSPVSMRLQDSFEAGFILQRLKGAGVRFAPGAWPRSIGKDAVLLYDVHTGDEWEAPADAVVLATGRTPIGGLAEDLAGKVAQLFAIGDASSARVLAAATYEGQMFARLIGEPDAPRTVAEAFFRPDAPSIAPLPADAAR